MEHHSLARSTLRPYPSSGPNFDAFARDLTAAGYHSQHGQDKWIAEVLLPDKFAGVFVDAGAYDGVTLSNSLYLERERAWTGLAIEPNPDAYRQLIAERECDTEQVAVGALTGEVTFRVVTGYSAMLSGIAGSYDKRHRERIETEVLERGGNYSDIVVPCDRLDDLLERHGLEHIDYLSIDVEGGELSILDTFDFDRFSVSVIGVENNYLDSRIPRLLADKGFRFHSIVGDEFYVRDDDSRWRSD